MEKDAMGQSVEDLRGAVREKYRAVARRAEGHFPYPVGRAGALRLGYEAEWLDAAPVEVVKRFVGVGRPFAIRTPARGERVLDVGCGCGLDAFLAAWLVGPRGRVAGVDCTPEMVEHAQRALEATGMRHLIFGVGPAESLLCNMPERLWDLVISNGALNLVPDKPAAFREIHRVLRPGGVLAVADLLVVETVPEAVLASMDAWSS